MDQRRAATVGGGSDTVSVSTDDLRTLAASDYGVPGDLIFAAASELDRVRSAIVAAPHADWCQWPSDEDGDPEAYGNYCNCWKADAL